jgi:MinD-like ATPase involved in chromosome partitioning or flagellar assembly
MGSILVIHSFRGGTGKSNIVANLAYCHASTGLKVGIVDTDIQSPGIHIIFGLKESQMKYCLNDYLKGNCSIEDAVYNVGKDLNLKRGVIHLIPSRLNANEIVKMMKDGFDIPRLTRGISELAEKLQLDILYIDTHPGIEEETLLSIAISDILTVILRPDEQDYLGTAITLEIAKRIGVPKTYLIANRVPREIKTESFKNSLEKIYNIPVVGVIPFSYNLMMNQSKSLLSLTSPKDPFSVEIRATAEKIYSLKQ